MNEPAASDGTWRISDSDRDAAVPARGEHNAPGRRAKAEYDERGDRAGAARTNHAQPPRFRDLPLPHGNVVGPEVVARRASLAGPSYRRPAWAPRRRGPLGPLGPLPFLVILLVLMLHAPWLLMVMLIAWLLLRAARRR